MKQLIIFFLLLSSVEITLATEFSISPININFRGIEINNETIAAYGDFGSMLISFDNARNWKQIKIFKFGCVVKLFVEGSKITAFSDLGEIGITDDNGASWTYKRISNDTILAVIKYTDGYFLRAKKSLFIIDHDYKFKRAHQLISKDLIVPLLDYKYNFSIAYFKNYLIAEIDSARFIRFDEQLKLIDIISYPEFKNNNFGYFQIFADDNYFYNQIEQSIYRTKDFSSIERIYTTKRNFKYAVIDNAVYINEFSLYSGYQSPFYGTLFRLLYPDSVQSVVSYKNNYMKGWIQLKDFTVKNNQLFIAGDSKFISSINFNDSVLNIFSDFVGHGLYTPPDRINDSSFLFFDKYYYGLYHNYISRTDDEGRTFKPVVNLDSNPELQLRNYILFKLNEDNGKKIYLGGTKDFTGSGGIFVSNDTGKTFSYKPLTQFVFDVQWSPLYFPYLPSFPNLYKNNNSFVTARNIQNKSTYYTAIYSFDLNFNLQSRYIDSNLVVDYIIESKDTNSFLIHCLDYSDSSTKFKFTYDKGKHWEIIKSYPLSDSILYYKEFEFNSKNYLAKLFYHQSDSIVTIDILDIEDKKINKLYEYWDNLVKYSDIINSAITSDGKVIYLAVNDTLFEIQDLFDRSKWQHKIFPRKGRVIRTFEKSGDKFFARYIDSLNPENIYWIKLLNNEVPKPKILVNDIDFGIHDIRDSLYQSRTVKIENISNNSNLIINGFKSISDSVFIMQLPELDSNNTITIKPSGFYEFKVTFKPKEVKKYCDSVIFFSNADSFDNVMILNGEGIDTQKVESVELLENDPNYFFCIPPYPIPAKDNISMIIYWDRANTPVLGGIYDIFGKKIEGTENLEFNMRSDYCAIINWNCSTIAPGIYFIKFSHGKNNKLIKVLKIGYE